MNDNQILLNTSVRSLSKNWDQFPVLPLHYAEVVEIRILKCPTLTNCFSAVFRPGCPKFCVELRKPPKNLEKAKKEKHEEEKEGENAKNMKGVFAKVKTGLKKIVLINATIFALCTFLANTP